MDIEGHYLKPKIIEDFNKSQETHWCWPFTLSTGPHASEASNLEPCSVVY